MSATRGARLILIVEPDLEFIEDTRALLQGERVLTARSLEEAAEIAVGGRVDLTVLGPSFGTESGVLAAAELLRVDPDLPMVLAANVVTNRVLRAALRVGFVDVIDTPVTERKLAETYGAVSAPGQSVDVVMESSAPPAQSAPSESASWDRPGEVQTPVPQQPVPEPVEQYLDPVPPVLPTNRQPVAQSQYVDQVPVVPPVQPEYVDQAPVAPPVQPQYVDQAPVAPPVQPQYVDQVPVAPPVQPEYVDPAPVAPPGQPQ
ncbi:hypothetical protein HQ535_05340, partial [bacterium]|nr:hypothetical protein [bacterium]